MPRWVAHQPQTRTTAATFSDLELSLNAAERTKLCSELGVATHRHLRFLREKQIRAMHLRPVPSAILRVLMQQLEADATALGTRLPMSEDLMSAMNSAESAKLDEALSALDTDADAVLSEKLSLLPRPRLGALGSTWRTVPLGLLHELYEASLHGGGGSGAATVGTASRDAELRDSASALAPGVAPPAAPADAPSQPPLLPPPPPMVISQPSSEWQSFLGELNVTERAGLDKLGASRKTHLR